MSSRRFGAKVDYGLELGKAAPTLSPQVRAPPKAEIQAAALPTSGKSLTLCSASWISRVPLAERPMRAGCVKGCFVLLPSACL